MTNSSSSDETAIDSGYRWVRGHQQPGEKILLWIPLKGNLRNSAEAERISRAFDVVVGTSRGRNSGHWYRGPVLGLWHDTKDLARMPGGRLTALCMVPWDPPSLAGWVNAVGPEILGDGRDWLGIGTGETLDPVVVRGLEVVTACINHANPISVGYEKRDVVESLLALHDAGYQLPPEELRSWALAHEWQADNANRLSDFGRRINQGGRPRIKGRVHDPNMVQRWRAEATVQSRT